MERANCVLLSTVPLGERLRGRRRVARKRESPADPGVVVQYGVASRADLERPTQVVENSATEDARLAERAEPGPDHARGTTVGRYMLLDKLGAGGMGDVYAAFDPELARRVAIKLVGTRAKGDRGEAQQRLLREAQALAKLSHPNVVSVFDAGTHGDQVYLAMEYVEGVTLGEWVDAKPRRWSAVLRALIAAGRGLAAAHVAGLVHRDFKPSNVMVTEATAAGDTQPRVRVLDFGLARGLDAAQTAEPCELSTSSGSLQSLDGLTRTGTLLGTPAYMAPEHFAGRLVDERSDQFAFCVVAYKLLYGRSPFPYADADELMDRVLRGDLVPPPRTTRVPAGVGAALQRGLARRPADRWPSMDALLRRLERALRFRRNVVLAGVGTVAVLGMAGVVTLEPGGPAPCEGVGGDLQEVWSDAVKGQVRAAFEATGKPYAADAWSAVQRSFDDFQSHYVAQRRDICEATAVRREQSETLLDLRMACMDDARQELAALVDVLAEADGEVVEHAVGASSRLPSLRRCDDVQALRAEVAPPTAEVAAEVEAIMAEVRRQSALTKAGKFVSVREEGTALVERAEATGYPPVVAASALAAGQAAELTDASDDALELYAKALAAAARAGDRTKEARALIGQSNVLSIRLRKHDEARRPGRHASAILQGLDAEPWLKTVAALTVANSYYLENDYAEAEPRLNEVIEMAGDDPAAQRARVAAVSNLVGVRMARGDLDGAAALFEETLPAVEAWLGSQHPLVGNFKNNLGLLDYRRGNYESALQTMDEALQIYRGAVGSESLDVARTLHNRAVVLRVLERHEQARSAFEEALAIKEKVVGTEHVSYAQTAGSLADVRSALAEHAGAVELAKRAEAILHEQLGPEHPNTFAVTSTLADVLRAAGRTEEALEISARALQAAREHEDKLGPWDLAGIEFSRARILHDAGRTDEAMTLAKSARKRLHNAQGQGAVSVEDVDDWLNSRR